MNPRIQIETANVAVISGVTARPDITPFSVDFPQMVQGSFFQFPRDSYITGAVLTTSIRNESALVAAGAALAVNSSYRTIFGQIPHLLLSTYVNSSYISNVPAAVPGKVAVEFELPMAFFVGSGTQVSLYIGGDSNLPYPEIIAEGVIYFINKVNYDKIRS